MISLYSKYPNFQGANLQGVKFIEFLEECKNYKKNNSQRSLFDECKAYQLNDHIYYEDGILVFIEANCQDANFQGLDIHRADFQGAVLRNASFQSVHLYEVVFEGADIRNANLQFADIFATNFQNADLRNANLQSAVIRGVQFQGADIRNANLKRADLHEANFEYAELHGANLEECKGWKNCDVRWSKAKYDDKTNFPVGFDPNEYGLTKTRKRYNYNNNVRTSEKLTYENGTDTQIQEVCVKIQNYIQKRQGQQKFRAALLKCYRCRCAITDSNTNYVLEAAHIKPYSLDKKNNSPENGILLRADLHILFDLNIIVIHPDTKRIEIRSDSQQIEMISSLIYSSEYQKFNGIILPSYENFGVCPGDDYLRWRYYHYGEYVKKYMGKLL